MKRTLTDRTLKALKAPPAGQRTEIADAVVPGLRVRVTSTGTRTFVLLARFPGSRNPTRRALGEVGAITLEQARVKARHWHELLHKGIDPAVEEERQRQAELRRHAATFANVADQYQAYARRQKLRSIAQIEGDLRTVLVPRWGQRPITDIVADDIKRVIREAVERGAKYAAFRLHALIRRLFNWAIGTDDYGLVVNPCSRISVRDLVGERRARERTLTDDEIRALWRVTGRLRYPYGPIYRVLLLSGVRLGEACGAQWNEFDLAGRIWTIPASRIKSAKAHVVPISDALLEVLQGVPRFKSGEFLFSNSFGVRGLRSNQFMEAKAKLDRRMLHTLRAMARTRGDNASRVALPHWVNHDIRRVVRSQLSALRVPMEVAEAVLAHAIPGIRGVYDRFNYLDAKREALTLWAARLRDITVPPPANVVALRARGA